MPITYSGGPYGYHQPPPEQQQQGYGAQNQGYGGSRQGYANPYYGAQPFGGPPLQGQMALGPVPAGWNGGQRGGYNSLPSYGGQAQTPNDPLGAYIGGQGAALKKQQGSALGSWDLRSGSPVFIPQTNTPENQSFGMGGTQSPVYSGAQPAPLDPNKTWQQYNPGASIEGNMGLFNNPTNLPNKFGNPTNPKASQPYGSLTAYNAPMGQNPAGGTMQGFYQ